MRRHILLIAVLLSSATLFLQTSCGTAPSPTPVPTPGPTNTAAVNTSSPSSDPALALKPSCSKPDFPEPTALGIDAQCGNEGNGGKEAEQNSVKNNYCPPSETPEDTTIAVLQQLQISVQKNPSINFGSSGPTTDRSPLKTLGEGKLVSLRVFVLKARQEGGESVNCKGKVPDDPLFHDIHIAFVDAANKPQPGDTKPISDKKECTGIVAEMSPHHRPDIWTADNVNKVATAQALVRITGQQFFDSSHVPCSNGAPVGSSQAYLALGDSSDL